MNLHWSVGILTHLLQTKASGQNCFQIDPLTFTQRLHFLKFILVKFLMIQSTPSKCKDKSLFCTQKSASCSANRTSSPTSTEHVPTWSKIQKVSIIHSKPITQTQTLEHQAKHRQLNAVTLKAACSQTKALRLPAKMKLKKRKIKKLNFQLIHFRRGWLVAAARNIKVGLKQQPLLLFRDGGAEWLVSKWSRGELLIMDGMEENHVMAASAESMQPPCYNFAKFLFWSLPCC